MDYLRQIYQPASALLCNNPKCRNGQHRNALAKFYTDIIKALISSGIDSFGYKKANSKIVPGWNEYLRDLHRHARSAFLLWRDHNSPRLGPIAQLMRNTRAQFKLALRQCKENEAFLRAAALSSKLSSHNYQKFWKEIQSLSPKSNKTAQRVGGAVGDENIANMWSDHFSSILNCIDDQVSKTKIDEILSADNTDERATHISTSDVEHSIKQLASNKAEGCDGLSAEAYKHSHPMLYQMLSALFNSCLRHKFLPKSLLLVHLIPLIKNKLKDSADPGNYRPIAITTIASKIFESLILSQLQPYIKTADNQFGFKANHSTDTCIYLLKDIINYFNNSGSPIYLCFVDVRKAFDRVNYLKLFLKLRDKGTPLYLIGILNYWFSTQQFCVSWGSVISNSFGSSNGLRQGGILSPHLFNAYIDGLNHELNTLPIGCMVNGMAINNLCYADDMVLISPTATGLQTLINTCCIFANNHDIIYNETKTQCMAIMPKRLKSIPDPLITLEGHRLQFVNEFPYLGHIISKDLKDNADINNRRRKLCAIGNMITRRFAFCNLSTKLTLFKSYFYSIYACALWSNYNQEYIRRLTVVHNDILRRLTITPRYESAKNLFARHNLNQIKVITRNTMVSLIKRLESSNNILIQNTLLSDTRSVSNIWRKMLAEAYTH